MEESIGKRLSKNGCRFRVYAPNAAAMHVREFNNWSQDPTNLLAKSDDDYWEGEVAEATKGQKYRYLLVTQDGSPPLRKIDPAARDTVDSGLGDSNNGGFIVFNQNATMTGNLT